MIIGQSSLVIIFDADHHWSYPGASSDPILRFSGRRRRPDGLCGEKARVMMMMMMLLLLLLLLLMMIIMVSGKVSCDCLKMFTDATNIVSCRSMDFEAFSAMSIWKSFPHGIFPNIPEYSQIFLNIPKYFQIFPDIGIGKAIMTEAASF